MWQCPHLQCEQLHVGPARPRLPPRPATLCGGSTRFCAYHAQIWRIHVLGRAAGRLGGRTAHGRALRGDELCAEGAPVAQGLHRLVLAIVPALSRSACAAGAAQRREAALGRRAGLRHRVERTGARVAVGALRSRARARGELRMSSHRRHAEATAQAEVTRRCTAQVGCAHRTQSNFPSLCLSGMTCCSSHSGQRSTDGGALSSALTGSCARCTHDRCVRRYFIFGTVHREAS